MLRGVDNLRSGKKKASTRPGLWTLLAGDGLSPIQPFQVQTFRQPRVVRG